jgi:hypothetical protein
MMVVEYSLTIILRSFLNVKLLTNLILVKKLPIVRVSQVPRLMMLKTASINVWLILKEQVAIVVIKMQLPV